jgi:cation transport ATPase
MKTKQSFEVEHAGCAACAERIRQVLAAVATVDRIEVDEDADAAIVVISADGVERATVDEALARASVGSGHDFRVRDGSWRTSA